MAEKEFKVSRIYTLPDGVYASGVYAVIDDGNKNHPLYRLALTEIRGPIDSALNGTSVNPVQNKAVKAALDLKGDITTIADAIVLSIDPDTYVMSATLKKGNTVIAESNTIDLPLETMVVGGTYDSSTKKVILTLKNGQTVEFSVADLVSGLLSSVEHDSSLTGYGTSAHPLGVVVDSALSSTSENPVQNKAIYAAIGDVESLLAAL